MPVVPELISTMKYSNRQTNTAHSTVPTSLNPISDPSLASSRPRYLPEPIETTRRSNRTLPGSEQSSVPSSNSSSSISPKNNSSVSHFTFLPQPVESTRRSNRIKTTNNENGLSRDDEKQESNLENGKSKESETTRWSAPSKAAASKDNQPRNRIQDSSNSEQQRAESNKTLKSFLPQQGIISQSQSNPGNNADINVINNAYHHHNYSGRYWTDSNTKYRSSSDLSDRGYNSEESVSSCSLSSSPGSITSSTCSRPTTNYLLSSQSKNGHIPTRESTVIPLKSPAEGSPRERHRRDSEEEIDERQRKTHHPFVAIDFAYSREPISPNRIFPKPTRFFPGADQPSLAASNNTYITPAPASFSSRKLDINSRISSNEVKSIRDKVLLAQSQLLRDHSLLSPNYTSTSKTTSNLQNSSSSPSTLSAKSDEQSKRKKPLLPFSFIPASPRSMISLNSAANTPAILYDSPIPTTLFYESSKNGDYFTSKKPSAMSTSSYSSVLSKDTCITTPSTRPSSPSPLKFASDTSSSSIGELVHEPLSLEPPNMCPTKRDEVCSEFVLTVFNYVSMNHEALGKKFDNELSGATGWSMERVQTDRFGALREYIEEYVEKKPRFGSGQHYYW